MFSKELIKDILIEYTQRKSEEQALIKEFNDFATYFIGFHQNRQNMYTDEEKLTAISYRIIHQNLPKFLIKDDNVPLPVDEYAVLSYDEDKDNTMFLFQSL